LKGGVHSQAVLIEGAHSQTSPNLREGVGRKGGAGRKSWEGRGLGMRRYSTNDVFYLVPLPLLWTLILWMCRLHGTNLRVSSFFYTLGLNPHVPVREKRARREEGGGGGERKGEEGGGRGGKEGGGGRRDKEEGEWGR